MEEESEYRTGDILFDEDIDNKIIIISESESQNNPCMDCCYYDLCHNSNNIDESQHCEYNNKSIIFKNITELL